MDPGDHDRRFGIELPEVETEACGAAQTPGRGVEFGDQARTRVRIDVDPVDLGQAMRKERAGAVGRIEAEVARIELEVAQAGVELDVRLAIAESDAEEGRTAREIEARLHALIALLVADVEVQCRAASAGEALRGLPLAVGGKQLHPAAGADVADALARRVELCRDGVGAAVPDLARELADQHRLEHRLIRRTGEQEIEGGRIEDQLDLNEAARADDVASGQAERGGRRARARIDEQDALADQLDGCPWIDRSMSVDPSATPVTSVSALRVLKLTSRPIRLPA